MAVEESPQEMLFEVETAANEPQEVPGVSVSLEAHAKHISGALDFLAKASELDGLQRGAETPPHAQEIAGRYGEDLPSMLDNAVHKERVVNEDARFQFAYGSGYISLKHSGLFPAEDIESAVRQDFQDFASTFSVSAARQARDAYRKTLARRSKTLQ
jgi:hypothetical protein